MSRTHAIDLLLGDTYPHCPAQFNRQSNQLKYTSQIVIEQQSRGRAIPFRIGKKREESCSKSEVFTCSVPDKSLPAQKDNEPLEILIVKKYVTDNGLLMTDQFHHLDPPTLRNNRFDLIEESGK